MYWSVLCRLPASMMIMGRVTHTLRPFVAALLVLQFSAYCGSQHPLPVLPLNRFGTKNTYNNTYSEKHGSSSQTVEETEFCCPPVQVAEFIVTVEVCRHTHHFNGHFPGQPGLASFLLNSQFPVIFVTSSVSILGQAKAQGDFQISGPIHTHGNAMHNCIYGT